MVRGKVSKAIVASFLCLTINVGCNVTNAMKEECLISANSCNDFDPENDPVYSNNKGNLLDDKKKGEQVDNDQNKDKKDKNDQDKDGKNKNIWRWLIGIIAGVGGLIVGLCLGKFAFNI